MSVSILIVSHERIGEELIATAERMLGAQPLLTRTLSIAFDAEPEQALLRAETLVAELDVGDGVLVLTDMYGSTPSNIAHRLSARHKTRVVSGINLPMLIRLMNYPDLDLNDLAHKAYSGGRDGVLIGENGC